jgi:hypothetical protein
LYFPKSRRLDGQQTATFSVEHKEQPIQEDEGRVIKGRIVGGRYTVGGTVSETAGQIFKDVKDALAEVALEFGLAGKRFLPDLIERTTPIGCARERLRSEQGDEEPEILERTKVLTIGQRELEVGVAGGPFAVEPPSVAVGENGPVEQPGARGVLGMTKVVLNLLAGKQPGRLPLRDLVKRVLPFLRLQHSISQAEDVRGLSFGCSLLLRLSGGEEAVVGTLPGQSLWELGLRDKVPTKISKERIEEGGPGVGLILSTETRQVFAPAGLCRLVALRCFVGRREVFGVPEVSREVGSGEYTTADKR